ncbi:unnamed protein product, partial [Rotaria sordida]
MTIKDWGQSLKKNIPERKGWVIKNQSVNIGSGISILHVDSERNYRRITGT